MSALLQPSWITREVARSFENTVRFMEQIRKTYPYKPRVRRGGVVFVCRDEPDGTIRCGACLRGVVWPCRIKFCRVCGAEKVGPWNRRDWRESGAISKAVPISLKTGGAF